MGVAANSKMYKVKLSGFTVTPSGKFQLLRRAIRSGWDWLRRDLQSLGVKAQRLHLTLLALRRKLLPVEVDVDCANVSNSQWKLRPGLKQFFIRGEQSLLRGRIAVGSSADPGFVPRLEQDREASCRWCLRHWFPRRG